MSSMLGGGHVPIDPLPPSQSTLDHPLRGKRLTTDDERSPEPEILNALPPELLMQIAASGGSRVVLVTGAGASMEAPTSLKSGADYSEEAHEHLILDTVLQPGACADPRDLSVLADVVYGATGSQLELTKRLPRNDWRAPTPNSGHLAAAALLIEGSLRALVTLNYDLALQVALANLGKPPEVSICKGPEDHDQTSSRALVYLHRSAESAPEDWILRKSALDHDWRQAWEQMVATGALAAPVTLFAGLGSPAAVLTETVTSLARLRGTSFFYADLFPESEFSRAVATELSARIRMGWGAVMDTLASRVAHEQGLHLRDEARGLATSAGLPERSADAIVARLCGMGLVSLGRIRSSWLLFKHPYLRDDAQRSCVADLIATLGAIAAALSVTADFDEQGGVHLLHPSGELVSLRVVHGGGIRTWALVRSQLEVQRQDARDFGRSRVVLVAGLASGIDPLPADLVHHDSPDDLIRGGDELIALEAHEVRSALLDDASELKRRLVA